MYGLGRRPEFDARSRGFAVRDLVATKAPRSYSWLLPQHLNQGQTEECTGFSTAQEIAARPVVSVVSPALAHRIYLRARELDEWPGEDYEGSSVLGAVKAATEFGFYKEYRWAFGLDDLILAVGYTGPAILGINWYEAMFSPTRTADGRAHIKLAGSLAGGHAILCNGVSVTRKQLHLANTWGTGWGNNGGAWISYSDVARLLAEQGEACVPTIRVKQ